MKDSQKIENKHKFATYCRVARKEQIINDNKESQINIIKNTIRTIKRRKECVSNTTNKRIDSMNRSGWRQYEKLGSIRFGENQSHSNSNGYGWKW